jgi:hypothetical protein
LLNLSCAGNSGSDLCFAGQKGLKESMRGAEATWQIRSAWGMRHLPGVVLLALAPFWPGFGTAAEPTPINLAAFGSVSVADKTHPVIRSDAAFLATEQRRSAALVPGNALFVEWNHARPVRSVRLVFPGAVPNPDQVTLEWWRRVWPDNGRGGWMKLDDPFNGQWTAVRATAKLEETGLCFSFNPLDEAEAPGVKRTGLDHRLTYKLRISSSLPVILNGLGVFSDAVAKRAELRFEWGVKTTVAGKWSPVFEARNGHIIRIRRIRARTAVVEVEYADAPDRLSPDRGQVVFRSGENRSFAVFVDDVLREGGLYVRDLGVFVSDADKGLSYATWAGPPGEVWPEGTVVEQVARLPEQGFAQLKQAIPAKPARYLFLGVPSLRQEIALQPQGDIQLFADSLRSPGLDAALRPWRWDGLRYQFGCGENPVMGPKDDRVVTRSLEEGWLPVAVHRWQSEEVAYTQTSVAVPLTADIAALQSQTGTEPVVLVTRFDFKNIGSAPRQARLWMELDHPLPWHLAVDGTLVLSHPSDGVDRFGLVPVRGRFNVFGKGDLDLAALIPGRPGSYNPALKDSAAAREAIRYQVELGPGQSHSIELSVPYVELLDANELAALKALTFAQARDSAVRFWRERVGRGMTYDVPEEYLNEFFKANLWRVLISTDLDPVTGQHQHGAATHHYPNFLNETVMVARSLEMRGEHAEALRLLAPFLANQGVKALPGNFRTRAGVLYAAHPGEPDPYTAQGYNMHHGWGLWAAAEHYYWTRDQQYLAGVAAQLAKAAEWIVFERQATKRQALDGSRPVEYGLAPAGDLEDVEEYLYFYATDAYYYLGLKHAAGVLAELAARSQPAKGRKGQAAESSWRQLAARLLQEAEAFRQDIRSSMAESVATSPVVRLKDGTYVPYVPPRAYALTHLKEGWIREALYPALHLVNGEVYDEWHPYVDWMAQDLEDNIFLSQESGYGVPEQKSNYFHLGGFTLQPNLLDLCLLYLQRDQLPNYLRAFYNTAWASLYPDVVCFAEWVPALGKGGGPLYKTPDECKFIQWMRQMLVLERGQELELGLGVPRAWMADGKRVRIERAATWFGQLDLEIRSQAATGRITASIQLVPSEPPKAMRLRLRHPAGNPMRMATVNGKPAKINASRQLIELPLSDRQWQVEAAF